MQIDRFLGSSTPPQREDAKCTIGQIMTFSGAFPHRAKNTNFFQQLAWATEKNVCDQSCYRRQQEGARQAHGSEFPSHYSHLHGQPRNCPQRPSRYESNRRSHTRARVQKRRRKGKAHIGPSGGQAPRYSSDENPPEPRFRTDPLRYYFAGKKHLNHTRHDKCKDEEGENLGKQADRCFETGNVLTLPLPEA